MPTQENAWDMEDWDNYSAEDTYASEGVGSEAKTSLPFIINIQNTTTDDVSDVVFLGANSNSFTNNIPPPPFNFGNPEAIVITMENGTVTYQEFLESMKSQPFDVGVIYLQSANALQPFKTLRLFYREATGWEYDSPINPALDPMQQQSGVTIVRKNFPVNAFTKITTTILASATLSVRLYPTEQIDLARSFVGRDIGKDYSKPNLSQFQFPSRAALVG